MAKKGIDSNILPRLFKKFASISYKGTGLGLFISKGIIEAHGGKIWGENNSDGQPNSLSVCQLASMFPTQDISQLIKTSEIASIN